MNGRKRHGVSGPLRLKWPFTQTREARAEVGAEGGAEGGVEDEGGAEDEGAPSVVEGSSAYRSL